MRTRKIPPTFVIFRVTAAAVTVLVLLLTGWGMGGHGPLASLHVVTSQTMNWLRLNTGVGVR